MSYTFTGDINQDKQVALRMIQSTTNGEMTVSTLQQYGGLVVYNAFRALSYDGIVTMTPMTPTAGRRGKFYMTRLVK